MEYYKIVSQTKNKELPFYKQINIKNIILGYSGYSLGIKYSPDQYNKLLQDEKIYNVFIQKSVKQLLMNNYKFLSLINEQDRFSLELIDCKIKDAELDSLLQEAKLDLDILKIILDSGEYQIMQTFFRSEENYMVTLKSNGVIGIDKELIISDRVNIQKLIDYLGFGLAGEAIVLGEAVKIPSGIQFSKLSNASKSSDPKVSKQWGLEADHSLEQYEELVTLWRKKQTRGDN